MEQTECPVKLKAVLKITIKVWIADAFCRKSYADTLRLEQSELWERYLKNLWS